MQRCILIVTPEEFAQILPITNGATEWSNYNRELLVRLEKILGKEILHDVRQYHFCKVTMQSEVAGVRRVQKDHSSSDKVA